MMTQKSETNVNRGNEEQFSFASISKQFHQLNQDVSLFFTYLYTGGYSVRKEVDEIECKHHITSDEAIQCFLKFTKDYLDETSYQAALLLYREGSIVPGEISQVCNAKKVEIYYTHTWEDVEKIAHEFGHILFLGNNFTSQLLGETIPIFLENLAASYLRSFMEHDEIYIRQYKRMITNNTHVRDYVDSIGTCCAFPMYDIPYVLSSLLSVRLEQLYMQNKEETLKKLPVFLKALKTDDVTLAFQTLDLDVEYREGRLYCENDIRTRLVNDYFQYYIPRYQSVLNLPRVSKKRSLREKIKHFL